MPMPVTASTTAGSPRQKVSKFVLVSARKSRGADHWDKDDYDVRLGHASGAVVGRIMRHSQAPEEQPWYWTITARVRTFQLTHVRESDTRGAFLSPANVPGCPLHLAGVSAGSYSAHSNPVPARLGYGWATLPIRSVPSLCSRIKPTR
jgi:hypothetical protein